MGYGYAPRRSAPPSVHIVAILQYLGGIAMLLAAAAFGLVAFSADPSFTTTTDLIHPEDVPMVAAAAAGVAALIGLVVLVFARKLQRGRQWARVLTLIFCTLSVAAGAFTVLAERDPSAVAGMIVPALYILLLNTRAARSWFRAHTW
jgi:hypothetical protein